MPELTGKSTTGVGSDIVDYLDEVALFYGVSIRVTSGYRSPDGQAQAMYKNWVQMDHGRVYKPTTLPPADRTALDKDWETAHSKTASGSDRAKAKADFLKLARDKVGKKTLHASGRAIDVLRSGINKKVYRAITLRLREVKEGKRTDIYHFESKGKVPAVDAATKAKWPPL